MKLTISDLYDLDHTLAGDYLRQFTYPWEALAGIGDMISALGAALRPDEYDHPEEGVWVARDAKVYPTAYLGAPCIIGHKTEVRPGAFIRGNALVGDNCVVGNSTELKNVILFDNVQVPHYNYVGDSILGYKSHMGAGSITSNVKSDKLPRRHPQRRRGDRDRPQKGRRDARRLCGGRCNSVLNPGTVIGRDASVYPTSCVRGVVPERCICKAKGNIAVKNDKGEDVLKVIVAENHEEVSRLAADILGNGPREPCCCARSRHRLKPGRHVPGSFRALPRGGSDFSRVHSVNLDEYVGLAPTHEQSYRYFMDSNLFDHINIDKANTYVAKGTGNAEENLREFNAVLDRTDIDVQVLGVGRTVISASTSRATRSATAPTRRCSTRAPSTPTSASSPRATMCRATRSPWAWATSCARKAPYDRLRPQGGRNAPSAALRAHRPALPGNVSASAPRRRGAARTLSPTRSAIRRKPFIHRPLRIPRRGRPVSPFTLEDILYVWNCRIYRLAGGGSAASGRAAQAGIPRV